jgi:glycosyltransferase involved in cell wall biosynthesis
MQEASKDYIDTGAKLNDTVCRGGGETLLVPTKRLRVAMLNYSFYESDNRVRRYAETLSRRGDEVEVVSLRRPGQSLYNELNGVKVHRIQERVRDEKGRWDYLRRILKFFTRSAAALTRMHVNKPFDLVHVHSVPDFEVFAALLPKLTGAKLLLDIHDIVPELYCSKFQISKNSFVFKALVAAEKMASNFANHTIISNEIWRKRLIGRSVAAGRCTTILNFPDEQVFAKKPPQKKNGEIIFLYPGTLNYHQGLDVAIDAFGRIAGKVPHAEFHIYGDGPARAELIDRVRAMNLQDRIFINDPVSIDAIVGIMGSSDIGIIPKKNDSFGGEAFSTKTLEFMVLGVPIIVSRTNIDRDYFDEESVKFFTPGDPDDLASAMLAMVENGDLRHQIAARGQQFAMCRVWGVKKRIYLDLVDKLCAPHSNGVFT